jgi:Transposase DDE domain
MAIERWNPREELTKQEEVVAKHLKRVRTLLVFLRRRRCEIFNDDFQQELESMYRDTGAGKEPIIPALMAMATLVQDYLAVSDAEMTKLTAIDMSVRMVLDHLDGDGAAFAQGTFSDFRHRLIRFDMDRRLLERTVEIAKRTKEFDWRKLPGTLRVGIDSAPLEGVGRVEDTFNLLGHAARKVVTCAAALLKWEERRVCKEAEIPLLLKPSIKAALDIDWTDDEQKGEAIKVLTEQLDSLQSWLEKRLPEELIKPPLKEHVATLGQIRKQDLEPDPGGGGHRIREGVAPERRVSLEDPQMRHGRKNKNKLINGYKQHIAGDLDRELILAAAVTPANRPEGEAGPALKRDIDRQGLVISGAYFDRAYIASAMVKDILSEGGQVFCKPWMFKNGGLFTKADFVINMRDRTITCPSGLQTQPFELGTEVKFDAETCDGCPVRSLCTRARMGTGRCVAIAADEQLQQRMRKLLKTPAGRRRLRRRARIEHQLARVTQRQGRRARYRGTRKNLFALRRAATIHNLQVLHRKLDAAP